MTIFSDAFVTASAVFAAEIRVLDTVVTSLTSQILFILLAVLFLSLTDLNMNAKKTKSCSAGRGNIFRFQF